LLVYVAHHMSGLLCGIIAPPPSS